MRLREKHPRVFWTLVPDGPSYQTYGRPFTAAGLILLYSLGVVAFVTGLLILI